MYWNKDLIRAFRKKLGLKQAEFAELLGTSQEHISRWENEKRNPSSISQAALTLLAELKGVKEEELVKQ